MKGKRGPRPEPKEQKSPKKKSKANGHSRSPVEPILQCKRCSFHTTHLPEMTEHLAGSGHDEYDTVKPTNHKQNELYSEPGPVSRRLAVPLGDDELTALRKQVADLSLQAMEQEEILVTTKERIKALKSAENDILAKLRQPTKFTDVQCAWKINLEENSKTLVRLDTNEVVQTAALSAEDRTSELARVAAANTQQPAKAEGATASA